MAEKQEPSARQLAIRSQALIDQNASQLWDELSAIWHRCGCSDDFKAGLQIFLATPNAAELRALDDEFLECISRLAALGFQTMGLEELKTRAMREETRDG